MKRSIKNKKLILIFKKDKIKLCLSKTKSKDIKFGWLNSKANDLLIKSKGNNFSGKSYQNTDYETNRKRFLISLIHSIEVRWKEQHLMSLYRGIILIEECKNFTKNLDFKLELKGFFNFIKYDMIVKSQNKNLKLDIFNFFGILRRIYLLHRILILNQIYTYRNIYYQDEKSDIVTILCFGRDLEGLNEFCKNTNSLSKTISIDRSRAFLEKSKLIKFKWIKITPKIIVAFIQLSTVLIRRIVNKKKNEKLQIFISLTSAIISLPFYFKLRSIASKIYHETKIKNVLMFSGWEINWCFYLESMKKGIKCNIFTLPTTDPTLHLLKRPCHLLFTKSPYIYKEKLIQRGKQRGHLISSYTNNLNNNYSNNPTKGLAWIENLVFSGKNSEEEVYEGMLYAIKLSVISKKTLYVRFKPGTNSDIRKLKFEKLISKLNLKVVFHDENLDVLDLKNHCDSMVWSFGTSFFKLLPYIPIVYLQDKPKKFIIENSDCLLDEFSFKGLLNEWGSKSPKEALYNYLNNHNNIQERLASWRSQALKKHFDFTDDKLLLKKSWLKLVN